MKFKSKIKIKNIQECLPAHVQIKDYGRRISDIRKELKNDIKIYDRVYEQLKKNRNNKELQLYYKLIKESYDNCSVFEHSIGFKEVPKLLKDFAYQDFILICHNRINSLIEANEDVKTRFIKYINFANNKNFKTIEDVTDYLFSTEHYKHTEQLAKMGVI